MASPILGEVSPSKNNVESDAHAPQATHRDATQQEIVEGFVNAPSISCSRDEAPYEKIYLKEKVSTLAPGVKLARTSGASYQLEMRSPLSGPKECDAFGSIEWSGKEPLTLTWGKRALKCKPISYLPPPVVFDSEQTECLNKIQDMLDALNTDPYMNEIRDKLTKSIEAGLLRNANKNKKRLNGGLTYSKIEEAGGGQFVLDVWRTKENLRKFRINTLNDLLCLPSEAAKEYRNWVDISHNDIDLIRTTLRKK